MSIRNLNPHKNVYRSYLEAPSNEKQKPIDTSGGLMKSIQRSMQSTESKGMQPKEKAMGLFKALHEARMRHKDG